jgi:hypothetical protein
MMYHNELCDPPIYCPQYDHQLSIYEEGFGELPLMIFTVASGLGFYDFPVGNRRLERLSQFTGEVVESTFTPLESHARRKNGT